MNVKHLHFFRKIFYLIGLSLLASLFIKLLGTGFQLYYFSENILFLKEFSFLKMMHNFVSTFGHAFLAFLISSIFMSLFNKISINSKQSEAFLILTCLGFIAEGILNIFLWIQSLVNLLNGFENSSTLTWPLLLNSTLDLFFYLFPFFYAISIFVLYRYFTNLVKFESEVI